MKKSIVYYISLFSAAVGIMSCNSENELMEPSSFDSNQMIISASLEGTRTSFVDTGKGYKVVWTEGDKIYVDGKEFTLMSGAGTNVAKFAGEKLANGSYEAFYGISSKELPSKQTAVGGVIDSAPMLAQVEVTNGVASGTRFKNLCGLLSIHVTPELGCAASVKSITITADKPLSGAFEITDQTLHMTEPESSELTIDTLTLDCGGVEGVALSEEGNDFCLSLPAGVYEHFTITMAEADGTPIYVQRLATGNTLSIKESTETRVGSHIKLLNSEMPVGAVGWYRGREAVIADLGGNIGKLAIAMLNEGATSSDKNNWREYVGWGMSYTTAMNSTWNHGWHLPSKEEFEALNQYTRRWVFDSEGYDEGVEFTIGDTKLLFPVNFYTDEVRYWTSSMNTTYDQPYYMYADRGCYEVIPFAAWYTFGIRLFCTFAGPTKIE